MHAFADTKQLWLPKNHKISTITTTSYETLILFTSEN